MFHFPPPSLSFLLENIVAFLRLFLSPLNNQSSGRTYAASPPDAGCTMTFCSVKPHCSALTQNRCSRPIYSKLWASSFHLQEQSGTLGVLWALPSLPSCSCCFLYTSHFGHWTAVQLWELAPWPPSGLALNSLGAWPFWQAVNCQVWLHFSGPASVYNTLLNVLIVTSAGRHPRPWCH